MKKILLGFILTSLLTGLSFVSAAEDKMIDAPAGMVSVESNYDVTKTTDRLIELLEKKGMTIFNRVSHSDGAEKAGLTLRNTELVIFGNPKIGTPLMQCAQTAAIDLPQKALIWEGEDGKTWLSYNDPSYIKERHHIVGCDKVLEKITGALGGIAQAVTAK